LSGIKSYIAFVFFFLGIISNALAQIDLERKRFEDYPIRYILNKFSVNLSTGYGRTFYSHELDNFAYIRNAQGSFIIDNEADLQGSVPVNGYSNWFTGVTPAIINLDESLQTLPFRPIDNPINNPLLQNDYDIVTSDSVPIAMRGIGNNIPVTLSIYYNLRRLRLGGGLTANFHTLRDPAPKEFSPCFLLRKIKQNR
jgi:hypothetical protein